MSQKKGFIRSLKRRYDKGRWERRYAEAILRGEYALPPQHVKMATLKNNFPSPRPRVFVETGTYNGETVAEMKAFFDRVISIEIDEGLYRKAKERFRNDGNVAIVHADCVKGLPEVLAGIRGPAVFWLDGHYSGGGTGKGEVEDPILISLEQIGRHSVKEHTVFIDDARTFDGMEGRPDISEVFAKLKSINKDYVLRIQSDIIIAKSLRNL
ncbi:MAG: hypothetical protein HS130_01690 [Deltaproteobacteria bacterium]|nr:hypothetical protein [Deltaproteobacteria bacterium]MCL4874845.1 hypothetical protein [bacterium]